MRLLLSGTKDLPGGVRVVGFGWHLKRYPTSCGDDSQSVSFESSSLDKNYSRGECDSNVIAAAIMYGAVIKSFHQN